MATHDELAILRTEVAELRARLARAEATAPAKDAALFEAVIEHGSDAILVTGRDGRHVYANESAARLLGYTREELLDLSIADLMDADANHQAPLRIEEVLSGTSVRSDRTLRRKDGSLVRVDASARRVGDGLVAIVRDISDRVAMEASLRESETKYKNLFENAQVGIFRTKADGSEVADLNARFCEIVGAPREEALRRPAISWWADGKQRDEMVEELRQEGRIEAFEGSMVNARGERIDVLASATLYPDGYYEGSIVDVTERKRTERALRDSEARYRSVVDAMTDGIVVLGDDGAIVAVNAAAERIFGVTAGQMIGRFPLLPQVRVVREDGSPFPSTELPGLVTLRTGAPTTGAILGIHRPDGTLAWVSINSRRVTPLGEESAYSSVCSFRDITEKKRADEELLASLREKEVLLREIHHRVKNNLQIVTSLLYLQSTSQGDSRLEELLRESMNRVASMALVHQKLYESENLAKIPFQQYVRDLAHSLYRSYGVSPGRVGLRISEEDIFSSVAEAVPCGLILNELISNALEHAFPGTTSGEISVELALVGDHVHLRMRDNGIGLPPDVEERARASLGLKLVAQLTEQLGGSLERESTERGTSYEIVFRRDVAP